MTQPVYITFTWHMHQPYYKNIENNKFILPWVRLHAVKDYYDMAAILDDFPGIKQNFNLVPSLLLQIEEYLSGVKDIFQEMSEKSASALNDDERVFILYNFFMANWDTMVLVYPRYAYLLKKRGENTNPDEIRKIHRLFTVEEMRDLQVWFNMTWIDPMFLGMFPKLKKLKDKGENFTEEEKSYVLESHLEIMRLIIPKYRQLKEKGSIEISTTPFYHPILPLINNTDVAKECMPEMPPLDFNFSHPEDASAQVKKAVAYHAEKFGAPAAGMWPSEGSVSEAVMDIIAANSIKWVATDEEILRQSLRLSGEKPGNDDIYRPYTFSTPHGGVSMIFRNHYLSDLIGFSYQSWKPNEAAAHFMKELRHISANLGEGPHMINIILDGENCWEYYANDGRDFLEALYAAISADGQFESATVSGALEKLAGSAVELKKLYPGSWINHDFYIWIGHEDDRRSWKLLKKVRDDLSRWKDTHPAEKEKLAKAWESIYIAEGSDWNWWYGDDHSSKNDSEFDNLYRLHLMNVYRVIGENIPDELFVPIAKADLAFEIQPSMFLTPVIDGVNTHFYEWKGAGVIDLSKDGGAMHKTARIVKKLFYGFDTENLYIRLDTDGEAKNYPGLSVEARFYSPEGGASLKFIAEGRAISAVNCGVGGVEFGIHDIFEAKIPFGSIKAVTSAEDFNMLVFIHINGEEKEKVPEKGVIRVVMPDRFFELYNWKA
jgi:alpha-amylase/alpha-mannosidase (GH57 family)